MRCACQRGERRHRPEQEQSALCKGLMLRAQCQQNVICVTTQVHHGQCDPGMGSVMHSYVCAGSARMASGNAVAGGPTTEVFSLLTMPSIFRIMVTCV